MNALGAYFLFVTFTGGIAFFSERWFETPVNRWVRMHWGGEAKKEPF
jgi:peptidoglycan/LPS O-acetylase OafA/YrhL